MSQNERFVATERAETAVKVQKLDFSQMFFKQMNRKKGDPKQSLLKLLCFSRQSAKSGKIRRVLQMVVASNRLCGWINIGEHSE